MYMYVFTDFEETCSIARGENEEVSAVCAKNSHSSDYNHLDYCYMYVPPSCVHELVEWPPSCFASLLMRRKKQKEMDSGLQVRAIYTIHIHHDMDYMYIICRIHKNFCWIKISPMQ